MPRCRNCNFNLAHHDERSALEPGHCDSCNERVCFQCGCTGNGPCMRDGAACSWEQLTIGEAAPGQLGLAVMVTPGICSFCYQQMAAQAYAEINSLIEQAGGLVISAL